MDKDLLNLHEVINILEDNGLYKEADKLNQVFVKYSQKKKYDTIAFPGHLTNLTQFAEYVKVPKKVIFEMNPEAYGQGVQAGQMIAVPLGTKDPSKNLMRTPPKDTKTLEQRGKELMEKKRKEKIK